jgi:hypothetical protein
MQSIFWKIKPLFFHFIFFQINVVDPTEIALHSLGRHVTLRNIMLWPPRASVTMRKDETKKERKNKLYFYENDKEEEEEEVVVVVEEEEEKEEEEEEEEEEKNKFVLSF